MRFLLDDPQDVIQNDLANGRWFAQKELELIAKYCPLYANIIDIGANVGNHAIYFSTQMVAKKIYVIEPVVKTYKLLLANLCLNYCHNVNVDYVGLALGRFRAVGYAKQIYPHNLGSTRLFYDDSYGQEFESLGTVQIVPGDELFEDKHIDFIKLDVEEMEIEVLEGLVKTIHKCKPRMHIEVLYPNENDFHHWLKENHYKILDEHTDMQNHYNNYLVIHNEDSGIHYL